MDSGTSGLRLRCALLVQVAIALGLSGCASFPASVNPVSWWHDLQGGKIAEERPPPPGADQPYPNLASVPPKPAEPDRAALQNISSGLTADRAHAQLLADAAPLADPSSPSASPALFGKGTAPPPPPAPPPGQATASANMPAVSAPPAPPSGSVPAPSKAPVANVQSTPLAPPGSALPTPAEAAAPPPLSASPPPAANLPGAVASAPPPPLPAAPPPVAAAPPASPAVATQTLAPSRPSASPAASAAPILPQAAPSAPPPAVGATSAPPDTVATTTPAPALSPAANAAPSAPEPANTINSAPPAAASPVPSPPTAVATVTPEPPPVVGAGNTVSITFVNGSAALPSFANAPLRQLAARRGNGIIAVTGYGEAASNAPDAQSAALTLGLSRAQSIATALKSAGVPASAVKIAAEAIGRGGSARLLQ